MLKLDNDMNQTITLTNPWLVAVWPGMGQVAISAGYYLMSKLNMHLFADFSPKDLFDVEHVEVKEGLIRPVRLPRSRFFLWTDPEAKRDLLVFIGEAQPPHGKNAFCTKLIEYAQSLGVKQLFTFAAMATGMHPEHASRVFGAATDMTNLSELQRLELDIVQDGHIGGLNGLLLGTGLEMGLNGACLLGEMPHILSQLPFPKASLAILEKFIVLANIDIDLSELQEQSRQVDAQLGELLDQVQRAMSNSANSDVEATESLQSNEDSQLSSRDEEHIERLFEESRFDRSKAYELKRILDTLNVFPDYEERFLDLFKKAEE
jgi:proteasome assembly chaperone (PAC2) family protein